MNIQRTVKLCGDAISEENALKFKRVRNHSYLKLPSINFSKRVLRNVCQVNANSSLPNAYVCMKTWKELDPGHKK